MEHEKTKNALRLCSLFEVHELHTVTVSKFLIAMP